MVHWWLRLLPPPPSPRKTGETSQHRCHETEEHDRDQAWRRSTSTAAEDMNAPTPPFPVRRIYVSDYAGRGRLGVEFSTRRWQQRRLRHWTCRAVERHGPDVSSSVWRPGILHQTTGANDVVCTSLCETA